MRRLCGELIAELPPEVPGGPNDILTALCAAMSVRRGRPVNHRMATFPPGTASGLWLDMADQDLIVIEERTAPDHQLVILGHELWHMTAGHSRRQVDGDGTGVAARLLAGGVDLKDTVLKVAARSRSHAAEEEEAESFGLLLASKCRPWLLGTPGRGQVPSDGIAARIEASLGYRRPQG
ncbi:MULTISPECIES: toxin-antitoxin system, toxin component [unclassified Streptomyces]|uniref:toxin-antitoxin system, toxin component n=1 Tax=Streptomyces sp. NPDC005955 TaxID=3364738 RepID=UPI00368CC186